MTQAIPHRASVSTQKVAELVFEKILPNLQGQPIDAMVLSLICAATLAMRPNLEFEKLQKVIWEVSGFLINQLQDDVPANEAN